MAKKEPVPTTKSGLMVALAAAGEVKKAQAVAIYDKLIALAYEGARQNEKGWLIPGLGKLLIKKQGARKVRNPQTGEEFKKPACKVSCRNAGTVLRFIEHVIDRRLVLLLPCYTQ